MQKQQWKLQNKSRKLTNARDVWTDRRQLLYVNLATETTKHVSIYLFLTWLIVFTPKKIWLTIVVVVVALYIFGVICTATFLQTLSISEMFLRFYYFFEDFVWRFSLHHSFILFLFCYIFHINIVFLYIKNKILFKLTHVLETYSYRWSFLCVSLNYVSVTYFLQCPHQRTVIQQVSRVTNLL